MSSLGFGALLVIFLVAAAATWIAGLYLSRATDVLDDHFHLGDALGGMLLLGLAGSLPELAITASAAIRGDLALATGNLLGGIAMQTLVLVLLDATSGRPRPLSALVGNTGPLNEAGLVIGLVTIALMGGILPESTAIGPISPMSLAIVVYFVLGMAAINRARRRGDLHVEYGTKEAFRTRRQLVRLLVAEVTVGKKPEDGRTEVRITYRFGPPPASGSAGSPSQGGLFVSDVKNGSRS
jgi:Ca2+/Na+ antiporter